MRAVSILAALAALAASVAATPALAQTSLADLAARIEAGDPPADVASAPGSLVLPDEFAAILRTQPVDGGREQTLFISFASGRPILKYAALGARYRATGDCRRCTFPQPVRGHTHPYENPFSVQDLRLVASNNKASLMVTTAGQIWLAVPTQRTLMLPVWAYDEWLTLRYGLFGDRLECRAAPPGGWVAPSAMGRRVESVARAAADRLHIALYVSDQGPILRRLPPAPSDLDLLDPARTFTVGELNAYELSLLRLIQAAADARSTGGDWPRPEEARAGLEAALSRPARTEGNPGAAGGLRNVADISSLASGYWFDALPTTVYLQDFSDVHRNDVAFVSVQQSDDCGEIRVLHGEQAFTPAGVTYVQGWARDAAASGAIHDGWTDMEPAAFPSGQVVPW